MCREGNGAVRGLELSGVRWGAAEGAGIVQSAEEELRGDLIALYNCLILWRGGSWSFLSGNSDRMRGDGLKLHQEKLGLDIWKSFSRGVVGQWHRLPREVVESPFLEVSKKSGDVAPRNTVSGKYWWWMDGWTG